MRSGSRVLCGALFVVYVVILALPGLRGFYDLATLGPASQLAALVGAGLAIGFLWLTDDRFVPLRGVGLSDDLTGTMESDGDDARETPRSTPGQLRADFAFLEELVNGKPIAYLDSASSTQKPRQVLDAMRDVLRALVRERPPRRLPARGARDRGLRGGAAQGRRASSTRPPSAR